MSQKSEETQMILSARSKRKKNVLRTQGRKFKRDRNSEKIGRVVFATKESK